VNHSDVRNHLADYLEGDLELGKRALIDAHLDECTDCSSDLGEMQSTIALLRSLPEPEVPQDLVPNVMRRIRNGEGQRSWLDAARSALSWSISPPVLYPASLAMIFAGVLMATGQIRVTLPMLQPIELPGGQIVQLVPASPSPSPQSLAKDQTAPNRPTLDRNEVGRLLAAGPPVTRRPGNGQGGIPGPAPPILQARGTDGQYLVSSRLRMRTPNSGSNLQRVWPPWADLDRAQSVPLGRQAPGGQGFAQVHSVESPGVEASSSGIAPDRLPTPDEWLALVRRNPVNFTRKLVRLTLAEQELWVENLARRASEQGELDAVITALRDSGNERARLLAGDFSAAGARLTQTGQQRGADAPGENGVDGSSGAR